MATYIRFGPLANEVLNDVSLPIVCRVVQGSPAVEEISVYIEPRLREGEGGGGGGGGREGGQLGQHSCMGHIASAVLY